MPITIKSRSTKTGTKTGTSSRSSRSTGTRSRSTAKSTKTSTTRTRAPKQTEATEVTPRAAKAPEGMTQGELRKLIQKAERLGKTREAKREAWDEAVEEIHTFAAEMLEAGVSMAVVSRATGISRQWLYKIAEKVNGSTTTTKAKSNGRKTTARKPAAKKPAARRTSTTKTTSTRRSTRGTSSKPARGGVKIRSGR